MKTDQIRKKYLSFFESKGHKVIKSDSLIPHNDPTLLFTGAGMNQFKDYFLGLKKDFTRATTSQKCLRTGDLENVGRTAYHQTFFEMLGNFSFGDYFKREAITWAWEFLTKELCIRPELLRVSVYKDDEEAYKIWSEEVGIDPARIYKFGDKDNFWPSNAPKDGPNGPCGPCSEIFFDQGEDCGCGKDDCNPSCDCGRFAEIWNLVFTQFERMDGGQMKPLPACNIDTGMGLERVACVMQGKKTNFEIDVFEDIIKAVLKARGKGTDGFAEIKSSVYAITDHIRAAVFCICDGAYPSNEGRGYVIRKLIRRAIWHAHLIGIKNAFLTDIIPVVIHTYVEVYPDLASEEKQITDIIASEEDRFLNTIEGGLSLLNSLIDDLKAKGNSTLAGEDVFKLYDTYGFPDELTRLVCEKENIDIDQDGFEKEMQKQRELSKQGTAISDAIFSSTDFDRELSAQNPTVFHGYDKFEHKTAKITMMFKEDAAVDSISSGDKAFVVLDSTPFYAESGGQIGDTGILKTDKWEAKVLSCAKKDNVFYHELEVVKGEITIDSEVEACVDIDRRKRIMCNHTATHLLQAALRNVLGSQVRQMGSLVTDEKLRFDFSFPRSLSAEEKQKIEAIVQDEIKKNHRLITEVTTVEKAKEKGALAFFGDRYGDDVRLISIGDVSMELCGGTHCDETSEIGDVAIVSEGSVASGIRRIEAVTGEAANAYRKEKQAEAEAAERKAEEKKKAAEARKAAVKGAASKESIDEIFAASEQVGKYSLLSSVFDGLDQGGLRSVFDGIKQQASNSIAVLVSKVDDKLAIVVGVTKDVTEKAVSAGEIVKYLNPKIDGRGGGKNLLAFSGTKNVEEAEKIKGYVLEYLNININN